MEIPWLIIAEKAKENNDGTIDIIRIYQSYKTVPEHNPTILLVAKAQFELTESWEQKTIDVQLSGEEGNIRAWRFFYQVPDFSVMFNQTTYLKLFLPGASFSQSGIYTYTMSVDKEPKSKTELEVTIIHVSKGDE